MRTICRAAGLALALAVLAPARAEDEAYDLRGPAPAKGQVTVTKTTFKITNADVVLMVGGMKLDATQTLTAFAEEHVKVLAVEGRQATKVQTKVVKEQVESSTKIAGQNIDEKKPGELQDETIISERTENGKWKHKLLDTNPTEKQKKELDKRVGPENQDELYPAGRVKPGHTWTVNATALQRIFGGSISDLKGMMNMKFVRVEKLDGEDCAVIDFEGKITGVSKEDEGTLDVELELKGTTWRSVKTGLDVKDKATGKVRMSGKISMDGTEVDITLTGPVVIESTAKRK